MANVRIMVNIKTSLIFLVFLIINYSCKKAEVPQTGEIAINEIMPLNFTIVADQDGEYDDWLELVNLSPSTIDISGYYLSDKRGNVLKWKIPAGTSITGNGYLIIWADEDPEQTGLHSNFKLSSLGEELLLSMPDGTLIDEVIYPGQSLELSYSRFPDGTGPFRWQNPTYNNSNNGSN